MKYSKVLGLAAAAAFALMALAGPGAASATQVCKRVQSGGDGKCPNGSSEKELAKGESFTATSTDLVLTSPATDVACSSSSVTLKMTSENAILLVKGEVTALSFTDCETSGGTACVTAVANLPYEAALQNDEIIVSHRIGMPMRLNCGFLVSCEFIAQEQLLGVEGDLLVASSETTLTKGFLCPPMAGLDASYSTAGAPTEVTFDRGG